VRVESEGREAAEKVKLRWCGMELGESVLPKPEVARQMAAMRHSLERLPPLDWINHIHLAGCQWIATLYYRCPEIDSLGVSMEKITSRFEAKRRRSLLVALMFSTSSMSTPEHQASESISPPALGLSRHII
jgi:hypothetical protein